VLYFGKIRIVIFLSILLEGHLQQKENKIPQQLPLPKEQTARSKQVVWYLVYLHCLRRMMAAGL